MPNWKKVITSGSDASLNSLDVALDITGSNALITNDLDVLGNVGIGTTSPFYPLHINKNTVGNGFSINIFSTATKPDAQGGSVYGGFFFGKGNSTATVDNIVGSRNYGEHTGTGQATFIAGSSHFAVHNGSGNSTGIYAISPKAEIKGTGVGSHQYVIGANINNVLNNSNATVQYLEGAHIAVNLQNGTVTDNAIGLVLDFDYTAGVVSGDLDYLRIQNDTLPTVGGTARAINSLSTLPSVFAGDIGIGTTSPGAKLDVDGDVKFSSYGSGTNTGTATQRLGVTSAGNVIEIPIGSGAVDGSGTTNFVTKWIDGDTVGDSIIFDNGTNVGIGTTSPSNPLHVSSSDNILATFESTDAISEIRVKDNTKYTRLLTVGSDFKIMPNDGVEMAVFEGDTGNSYFNGGNVGIGTDSPTTPLHIDLGTVEIKAQLDAIGGFDGMLVEGTNASYNLIGGNGDKYTLGALNDGTFRIYNEGGAGYALTLDNTNKLGIGTTTPKERLDISAGSIRLDDLTSIKWATDDTKIGRVRITGNEANDYLSFFTDNSEKMRLTNTGLGIGTTSPGSKLDVNIPLGTSDGITIDTNDEVYSIWSNSNLGGLALSANIVGYTTRYDLFLKHSNGNVGIGTANPSQKLHVDGNARVTGAYYDSGNTPGTVNQILASTATGTSWIDPSTITADAASLVVIACKNTSGATITKGTPVYQTGNVGATATIEIAPADALISANKLPAIGVLQTDLNNNGLGNVVITGELTNFTTDPIDGVTPTVGDKVFVKSGGGLTLTKPTGEGNGIQNMGLVGKVSGGNAGSITVSSIMRTNDVPNLPEGRIWVGDGNTIVSDTVYIDEPNNRLGIGTTNPGEKLSVTGNIEVNVGAASAQGLIFNENGTQTMGIKYQGGQSGNPIDIFRYQDNTTKVRFLENGNVGIGTTSPAEKLHVAGNTLLQDTTLATTSKTTLIPLTSGGNSQLKIKGGNFIHSVAFETSWNDFEYAKLTGGYSTSDSHFDINKSDALGAIDATTRISTGNSFFAGNVGIGITVPLHDLSIEGTSSSLLKIRNTTNGGGAAIEFNDISSAATSQNGTLTYYHQDGVSQGGGASWHFESEPDTVLVIGSSTVSGRVVVKDGGGTTDVAYGFYDDIDTGMYRAGADSLRLVAGGVSGVSVSTTGVGLRYAGSTKIIHIKFRNHNNRYSNSNNLLR